MAFIGWYIKKDNILSGIILSSMLSLLGASAYYYFVNSKHYISSALCVLFYLLLTFGVLKSKKSRIAAIAVSIAGILFFYLFLLR